MGGWAGVNISFHNYATVRNVPVVRNRIIEQINADCRCKNDKSDFHGFLITSPYPYFIYIVSGLYLSNHLIYFNDT